MRMPTRFDVALRPIARMREFLPAKSLRHDSHSVERFIYAARTRSAASDAHRELIAEDRDECGHRAKNEDNASRTRSSLRSSHSQITSVFQPCACSAEM